MTGRIVFEPPWASACNSFNGCAGRAAAENYNPGTIWECDDCGKRWVVVTGAQYNEQYWAWRDASQPTLSGESRGAS